MVIIFPSDYWGGLCRPLNFHINDNIFYTMVILVFRILCVYLRVIMQPLYSKAHYAVMQD
ncbi:hypothetical protein LPB140_10895 [Sphingorhabdus lutea]|uniref:Uncharacterized protein n=1 Tax=Sphingorhabdus lutea TaxID=1913578 RepID=A0A1L3JDI7_9SPHN|nr:hypothetical protein LPB140_10895 [Sphingorhabdus lutea]